ncbi:uncharacterized protein LOC135157319 [Lytechinus pictus]|uniref:uncharacterized protein LOC135157319 n=1 Tax=Lytechinus pictus TaxID=7653 RepID=UPI0030BA0B49
MKYVRCTCLLKCLLLLGLNILAEEIDPTLKTVSCCNDEYGLNYTLPMFVHCTEKRHRNGSMIQTIPKLLPASSSEGTVCRMKSELGIRPGLRICSFPDCLSNPCVNGWCEESMSGYQCHCIAGYSGKHCMSYEPGSTSGQTNINISGTRIPSTDTPNTTKSPSEDTTNNVVNCTGLSSCPEDWIPGDGKCYRLPKWVPTHLNESVEYCNSLSPVDFGEKMRYPSLLVPESDRETDILRKCVLPIVHPTKDRCFLINCRRVHGRDGDGAFSCETDRFGNTTDYRNWKIGQPLNWEGDNCIRIIFRTKLKWNDGSCTDLSRYNLFCTFYFVCQIHVA